MQDIDMAMNEGAEMYKDVVRLLAVYQAAQSPYQEPEFSEVETQILSMAYGIQVRGGWRQICEAANDVEDTEYFILLSGGGPAIRIHGQLDDGYPVTAELEVCCWGIPWTRVPNTDSRALIDFANVFCFGG